MKYNKNNFAVGKVASKNDMKPELACVFFTKECTVATDSFSLVEMSVPKNYNQEDDNTEDFMLYAKSALKVKPEYFAESFLEKETVKFEIGKEEYRFPISTKGEYPKYKQVIPSKTPVATIALDGKKLKKIIEVLNGVNPKFGRLVMKVYDGESMPIVFEVKTKEQSALGLLMPLSRIDD